MSAYDSNKPQKTDVQWAADSYEAASNIFTVAEIARCWEVDEFELIQALASRSLPPHCAQ